MGEAKDKSEVRKKVLGQVGAEGNLGSLVQGGKEVYAAVSALFDAVIDVYGPYRGRHVSIDQSINEVFRYIDLASLYLDRFMISVNNPNLLAAPPTEEPPTEEPPVEEPPAEKAACSEPGEPHVDPACPPPTGPYPEPSIVGGPDGKSL